MHIWLLGAWRQEIHEEEHLQEVAALEYPIAVLDDPSWEPTETTVDLEARRASIAYEPAELSTDMPTNEYGDAQAESPEIDMVELAGQIRAAEPGEAEEIVDDAY